MPGSATETWLCGNRPIELSPERPFLLGILNVTPDSFSDGGKFVRRREAIRQGMALLESGDGVDVGRVDPARGGTGVCEGGEGKGDSGARGAPPGEARGFFVGGYL